MLIRSEVGEYLSRAEAIKKHLDSLKESRATGTVNLSKGPPRPPEVIFLHVSGLLPLNSTLESFIRLFPWPCLVTTPFRLQSTSRNELYNTTRNRIIDLPMSSTTVHWTISCSHRNVRSRRHLLLRIPHPFTDEKNEPSKITIRATMEEYLARAEALKKCLS